MAVSLAKGGNISLSKEAPGLTNILIGLGWDIRVTDGSAFDLDASVFLLGKDGKVRNDKDFIFYNNVKSIDGSVEHLGDNLTGIGDGDDESIKVTLTKVSSDIEKIIVIATIHEAQVRKQNFGMVKNAYIRVLNNDNKVEIVKFDLSEDVSTEVAMIFGEVYRHNSDWKFRAVGQGFKDGLYALCKNFGVNV
jgi:tellurium resistance protein TerD